MSVISSLNFDRCHIDLFSIFLPSKVNVVFLHELQFCIAVKVFLLRY